MIALAPGATRTGRRAPAGLGRLVVRYLTSHPLRSALTILAVVVAMFLFCILRSVLTSLDAAITASASNRIITGSAVSLFQTLPESYQPAIARIEGVESVCTFTWFGGLYQGPEGFFAQFATDPEILLSQYPEVKIDPEHQENWFRNRRGAIVGRGIAEKYGWKVGDTVPIIGTIYPRVDGSEWTFDVEGLYRSTKANVDEQTMYFHADYLRESQRTDQALGPEGSSVYIVKLAEGYAGEDVSARIDAYYDGGPQRTRTQTEAAFQAGFISMLGNLPTFIGMIVGAVLVAILFGVVNTMTIAARERTRAVGILKALGFPDRVPARLFLLESIVLVGVGTVLGILLSLWLEAPIRDKLGTQIPFFHIADDTILHAALIGLAVALLSGLWPARRAARLKPVEALRRGA